VIARALFCRYRLLFVHFCILCPFFAVHFLLEELDGTEKAKVALAARILSLGSLADILLCVAAKTGSKRDFFS
jgi:hypothetical protein